MISNKLKRDSIMSISPVKAIDSGTESAAFSDPNKIFYKQTQEKNRWVESENDLRGITPKAKLGNFHSKEMDPPLPILPKALKLID